MDIMLNYQSRDRKIDPLLLQSFGWNFKRRSHLHMTLLMMSRWDFYPEFTHSLNLSQVPVSLKVLSQTISKVPYKYGTSENFLVMSFCEEGTSSHRLQPFSVNIWKHMVHPAVIFRDANRTFGKNHWQWLQTLLLGNIAYPKQSDSALDK